MNIRFVFAALLCAFMIGDSRAAPMMVDGEQCVVPDASYVHVGVMNDRDRFFWVWCVTRFQRYWTMSLDPVDRTRDYTFEVGDARAQEKSTFIARTPVIDWGEPATAALEAAARNMAANDTHRPPVPQWRVQTNGTSKTRPGYVISDGKRSTTAAVERVPVGVACGCGETPGRAIEGKSVYCLVPGLKTPLLGALCTPGDATATIPAPPVTPPVTPPPPPAESWTKIAGEGQSFSVAAGTVVRYGAGSTWIQKTVSGAGACTNAFFGKDPAVGVTKQCQVQAAPPAPPAAGPGIVQPQTSGAATKSVAL